MIEFLCPNGHRIRCPDEQAGRAAKCPRCGVRFQIPGNPAAMPPSPPGVPPEPPQDESGEPQIEFLCPNGHRLHGPASLQGRPGQCPECGCKFRVPVYDDVADDEETEQDISLGSIDGAAQPDMALQQVDQIEPEDEPELAIDLGDDEEVVEHAPRPHPLAEIFCAMWADKPEAGCVELHFNDGTAMTPDRFAKDLSRANYGVFAVKDGDGTHTLTAVAWDSIARVAVRGVGQLPEEMAD